MNAGKPELGSKISLIPKEDIKSEGRLDPQECTNAIALASDFSQMNQQPPRVNQLHPKNQQLALVDLKLEPTIEDRLRAQLAELIVEKITWENTERNLKEEMEKLQREVFFLQKNLSVAGDLIHSLMKHL